MESGITLGCLDTDSSFKWAAGMIGFEWDSANAATTIKNYGVPCEEATSVFYDASADLSMMNPHRILCASKLTPPVTMRLSEDLLSYTGLPLPPVPPSAEASPLAAGFGDLGGRTSDEG